MKTTSAVTRTLTAARKDSGAKDSVEVKYVTWHGGPIVLGPVEDTFYVILTPEQWEEHDGVNHLHQGV